MKILVFFIYLFLETFFTISFGSRIGVFYLFLEIIISAVFGFIIFINVKNKSLKYLYDVNKLFNLNNFVGAIFYKIISGIFLIIPGVLSDLIGIGALLISIFTLRNKGSEKYHGENIIDVEIMEDEIEGKINTKFGFNP